MGIPCHSIIKLIRNTHKLIWPNIVTWLEYNFRFIHLYLSWNWSMWTLDKIDPRGLHRQKKPPQTTKLFCDKLHIVPCSIFLISSLHTKYANVLLNRIVICKFSCIYQLGYRFRFITVYWFAVASSYKQQNFKVG